MRVIAKYSTGRHAYPTQGLLKTELDGLKRHSTRLLHTNTLDKLLSESPRNSDVQLYRESFIYYLSFGNRPAFIGWLE